MGAMRERNRDSHAPVTKLAAVITDGLTNSRLDIYELDTMRRLERREGWIRTSRSIASGDGRLWFDIPDAVEHFLEQLRDFARVRDVSVVVPVARGATCALLDAEEALLPREIADAAGAARRGGVISYFNATGAHTDTIFDGMASPRERYRDYGLPPNFTGCTIPGRTVVFLANAYPDTVQRARAFIFGPEIMARQICAGGPSCGYTGLEMTYLMCHTGLWKDGRWSRLARAIDGFVMERTGMRLVGGLMPAAPGSSSDVFARVGKGVEAAYGLDANTEVLKGGHDSALADLPVMAACRQALGEREFVHFQAGSWGMARRIGGEPARVLPGGGFTRNVMLQGDLRGDPVLTASAPTGIEFRYYLGDDPAGEGSLRRELELDDQAARAYERSTLESVLSRREVFVTPGVVAGTGPYPRSVSRIYGMEKLRGDRGGELAYIALNLETAII
ncbi:MAG: hypothetical protein C4536_02015, partial [Actinobacteria bacterium]